MLEFLNWKLCEDCEPEENDLDRTVLACPIGDEVYYYLEKDCPYGWNVLRRMGAKFAVLPKPKFEKDEQ